jgi:hypothetical protein
MVPEFVMVALAPWDMIPSAKLPLAVMVPEFVMVASAPAEEIPKATPPVVMQPLLVTVSLGAVDVIGLTGTH